MKKILFALVVAATAQFGAQAQSNSNDKNYKICATDGKYQVCKPGMESDAGRIVTTKGPDASLNRLNSYTRVGDTPTPRYYGSAKRNPRIIVASDEPNAAYEGKESRINDGVKKNKDRNLNYLDASVTLPPVDGNN